MEQDQPVRDLVPDAEQEWVKARDAVAWAASDWDSEASAFARIAARK